MLGRLVRRLRAEAMLPLNQTTVLARLERDGELSTSALAERERMRPQSMAQTVKDLETAGLVVRRGDPSDARRLLLSLTPAGRKALSADRSRREDWLSEAIDSQLSAREQATLARSVELLRRLADRE